jgi:outer membrane protein assembly factor BamB
MRLKLILVILSLWPLSAQTNLLTVHNNLARLGQNAFETKLTTTNVNSVTFGKLFQAALDGVVDAEPLYVGGIPIPGQGTHNLLIVATENDSLYALDADTGAEIWKTALVPAGETASADGGCTQVVPQIGITSTPAIEFKTGSTEGAVLAVAMSKDAFGEYHHRLYKVNLTGGKTLASVEIAAKYPGTGIESNGTVDIFNPAQYKERSGLLLLNGVVYLSWASHCDRLPFTGWIMGYDANTLAETTVLNITPNGEAGAMWGSGAGFAADANGFIYAGAGNGTFDTALNAEGFPMKADFGNAFLKLSTAGNQLRVVDYFTMYNTNRESDGDRDLGSGGVMVLPDMTDVQGVVRHLAITAGKDNNIYVVDRDNMGKFNPENNAAIYQELPLVLPGGIFSMPAYFGGLVYFGSVRGPIRAFQFNKAMLSAAPVSTTATVFPYPGATPSISSNGSLNAILWAVENASPAVLHAYTAQNLAQELYNTNQAANGRDQFGNGNKFMVPAIVNGKVYVGTPNGVAAFGLLNSR